MQLGELTAKITGDYSGLTSAVAGASGLLDSYGRKVVSVNNSAKSSADKGTLAYERLKRSVDPLYASTKKYESAMKVLNSQLASGKINQAEFARMTTLASGTFKTAGASAMNMNDSLRASRFAAGNLTAQFNDIGVMMAAGQNPFTLAMQQGTQISQVLNNMGKEARILPTLAAGFTSMLNPVSLITLALIAGGAALVQWGVRTFRAEKETEALVKTLKDARQAMADLNAENRRSALGIDENEEVLQANVTKELQEQARIIERINELKDSTDKMEQGGLRFLTEALPRQEAKVRAAEQELTAYQSSLELQEELGDRLSQTTKAIATRLALFQEEEASLLHQIALNDTISEFGEKSLQLVALRLSRERELYAQKVAGMSLDEQQKESLISINELVLRQQQGLENSQLITTQFGSAWENIKARVAEVTGEYAKIKTEAEGLTRAAKQTADLEAIRVRYGKESLEYLRQQQAAERAALEIRIQAEGISKQLADRLRDALNYAQGLAQLELSGGIQLAATAASTLATQFGIAYENAYALAKLQTSGALNSPVGGAFAGFGGADGMSLGGGGIGFDGNNSEQSAFIRNLVPPKVNTGGGSKSGGGGGQGESDADKLRKETEERLEALRERFMTEAELQNETYQLQQETLRSAKEQQLITQQEFETLMEKSAKAHADKMGQLDTYRYGTAVQRTEKFFGEMATAFATGNERMLQISKVFGAAEALINSWRTFTQVMADETLPWYAKLPAAISLFGSAVQAVSAIQGVGKGGSGSSAVSGSGASGNAGSIAAGSEASQPMNRSLTLIGDRFNQAQAMEIAEFMNDGTDNGLVIRGRR